MKELRYHHFNFLLSILLRYYDSKNPTSKCENVIILPVFLKDVAYGMYDTGYCIAIAFECGCDVYANALEKAIEKYHQKLYCTNI